ncbi:Carbohydrate-binding WSC [Moelleriella libera RCEF 2490]|uniref:Carbohydrate-binding WSC n=1 Tax=Moelleriella libera RCEF 2490 TaxID=1081109 RepID=A0A167Y9R5_9HYPO|nr:Carbohydrate-binding WSC [Moelleriella libera RCEF 2490]
MTIEYCLQTCWMYNFAGVEYGRECWCGNKINLTPNGSTQPTRNATSTDCNFLCPGNQTEYCGAGVRLSMYTLKNSTLSKRLDWSLLWD